MKNGVRELRRERGLTQRQLAETVHVSSRTIISIERDRYNPSLLLAYRISLALDAPMPDLFCLSENLRLEDAAANGSGQRS